MPRLPDHLQPKNAPPGNEVAEAAPQADGEKPTALDAARVELEKSVRDRAAELAAAVAEEINKRRGRKIMPPPSTPDNGPERSNQMSQFEVSQEEQDFLVARRQAAAAVKAEETRRAALPDISKMSVLEIWKLKPEQQAELLAECARVLREG